MLKYGNHILRAALSQLIIMHKCDTNPLLSGVLTINNWLVRAIMTNTCRLHDTAAVLYPLPFISEGIIQTYVHHVDLCDMLLLARTQLLHFHNSPLHLQSVSGTNKRGRNVTKSLRSCNLRFKYLLIFRYISCQKILFY